MWDLSRIFNPAPPDEDKALPPPPEKGMARVWFLLKNHLGALMLVNLMFWLFCVPLLTIPASFSALNRVCILLYREGSCDVFGDFLREFRKSLFKSIPLGLLCLFFLADAGLCVYLALMFSGAFSIALFVAAAILAVVALLLGAYGFALMALIDLRIGALIWDALQLILLEVKSSFLMLLLQLVFIALAVWFVPYSLAALALIAMSTLTLTLCVFTNAAIEKHIISG